MRFAGLSLFAMLCAHALGAHEASPVGLWQTIDDETHKPRALVRIDEHDGLLSGHIVRLFREPGEDPDPRCKECRGERHDQRVIGMTILRNMHRDDDVWDGGEILDPEEGKTYRCKLHVTDDDARLEVRGYIGISLLGRTQIWERVEN